VAAQTRCAPALRSALGPPAWPCAFAGRACSSTRAGSKPSPSRFAVTNLGNAILNINLNPPWTVSQLEAEFEQAPLQELVTGLGFTLTGGTPPSPQLGFTLQANGTGNVINGNAQVPAGTRVQALAPSSKTISSGPFSLPIP
jgi:hypothetical protein